MKKICIVLSFVLLLCTFSAFAGCTQQEDVTSYNIDVELSGHTLCGEETVNFFNHTNNALAELKFNLFGNAFREGAKYNPIAAQYTSRAYPNGISYGDMQITKVQSGDVNLSFEICGEDMNILRVTLLEELYPDEYVEVNIGFKLNLANVVARTGYNDNTVNLANFYPILCAVTDDGFYECVYYSSGDPFYSDCANYTVRLTAPSTFNVASSGKLNEKNESGLKCTSVYTLNNARSFALVVSEKFESVTDVSTGVEINYYFYDDKTPDKSLKFAVESIALFNERFGAYPYPTYSVVQTEFIQGGMEFPGLVMISDNLEEAAYGEVIVHETAHQWWQSVVGNNEIEHGFLDEGLAEYSVVMFYENYPDYGITREQLIKSSESTYKVFCTVYDKVFGNTNTVMDRSLKDFSSEYEYVNMAYIKPCIMYDYLRTTIGDQAFFNGLKKYYKDYKFKNATPDDLVGVYEKTGADTNGFFESFFDGKVII